MQGFSALPRQAGHHGGSFYGGVHGFRPMFESPGAANRKITAGFTYLQRISKTATTNVWFPDALRKRLDTLMADGETLGAEHFPAEWAAIRQFELLQEAKNYKIYDLESTYLTRTMLDLTRSMRGGGYRVTVATIGSYEPSHATDDLEILDRRLQGRLSSMTHMLYLEEQSARVNEAMTQALANNAWDYRTALPHIGATLGAHNLFRPMGGGVQAMQETHIVLEAPYRLTTDALWVGDMGMVDARSDQPLICVKQDPAPGQYSVAGGIYQFAAADCGREMRICFMGRLVGSNSAGGNVKKFSAAENRARLAERFFDIVSLLPQKHIVHGTAVGLQLPEANSENEWIYIAQPEDTFHAFNVLMSDLFTPFDNVSLSGLQGHVPMGSEIKAGTLHMRGYGDRLTPQADKFYAGLAALALN